MNQVDVACRAFHQEVTVEVYNNDDDFSDDEGEVSPREVYRSIFSRPLFIAKLIFKFHRWAITFISCATNWLITTKSWLQC